MDFTEREKLQRKLLDYTEYLTELKLDNKRIKEDLAINKEDREDVAQTIKMLKKRLKEMD